MHVGQDAASKLRHELIAAYRGITDRSVDTSYLDVESWWRDSSILARIGGVLAEPYRNRGVTIVLSPDASGVAVGALTAQALGAGFAHVSKRRARTVDSDGWHSATTPPDYQDRHLTLNIRRALLRPSDRVVAVDDVIDTGAQLTALKRLVEAAGATWLGASVVIDNLKSNAPRRELSLHSLVHVRELS